MEKSRNLELRKSRWIRRLLLALGPCLLGGCASKSASPSQLTFGWDEDIDTPKTTPTPYEDSEKPADVIFDSNFCKNVRPGSCFSLVLRIPRLSLVNDLGLATLELALESSTMRSRLDEACHAAWRDYQSKYRDNSIYKQRSRLVGKVEKMRCIFAFDRQETPQENIKLAENEISMSVRMTKFAITGAQTNAQLGQVGFQLNRVASLVNFRNASIYSGAKVNPRNQGWHLVDGFGMTPVAVSRELKKDISWKIDVQKIVESIGAFAAKNTNPLTAVQTFYTEAQKSLASIRNPGDASSVFLGMGLNILQSLCVERPDQCKFERQAEDKTQNTNDEFSLLIPSSETSEIFRLAVIHSIQGILDELMVTTKPDQLASKFSLSSH